MIEEPTGEGSALPNGVQLSDAALSHGLDDLAEMYRRMSVIRRFENRTAALYRDGEIPGFVHISSGQEATAVGACWPLRTTDGIVSTHRGHGHCLAKGGDVDGMFAELMGRSTGTCGGLGGSMHIADVDLGIYGANGIVGAGLPIACGVASAFQQQAGDGVVVAFFGDGAVAQGAFHEALNLAAVWDLPVIFFCENNGYAEFSTFTSQHRVGVAERAAAYGMEGIRVDGNDVEAVADTMCRLVGARRTGRPGPALVEATTYRHHGHYEGDPEKYRSADERNRWRSSRDPLELVRRRYESAGGAVARLDDVDAEVANQVEAAIERARAAPPATIDQARKAVYAPRSPVGPIDAETVVAVGGGTYKVMDAIHDALEHAMEDDPGVWLLGIDMRAGNIFGLTRGLTEQFGDRIRDTPISETALLGCAVGAAMAGTRPVAEVMYLDFIGVCLDQLLNQAAKLRFMTGGKARVPLVVRTQFGSGRSSGAQHSQSLEALLAHIPGLTVVMPSTPEDAYGLLRTAIEEPNPVIVIENRSLYGKKGPKPDRDHRVPIGRGVVRRGGKDATVVSWSAMVDVCLAAATEAAVRGVEAEVIDLRTVAPLDLEIIAASVRRTGKLLIAHEAVVTGGLGGEIAAAIGTACYWELDSPIVRIAPEAMPAPYATLAEGAWMVDVSQVTAAICELAAR